MTVNTLTRYNRYLVQSVHVYTLRVLTFKSARSIGTKYETDDTDAELKKFTTLTGFEKQFSITLR